MLYDLLRDILLLQQGGGRDPQRGYPGRAGEVAAKVPFAWIRRAVTQVDELVEMMRRNIQKTIALDALIVTLRAV